MNGSLIVGAHLIWLEIKENLSAWRKKGGNVAFRDDSSTKILGKGTVKLGSENVKAGKVLLVEYLKHNLLNVSKICDQGYTLTFDSWKM